MSVAVLARGCGLYAWTESRGSRSQGMGVLGRSKYEKAVCGGERGAGFSHAADQGGRSQGASWISEIQRPSRGLRSLAWTPRVVREDYECGMTISEANPSWAGSDCLTCGCLISSVVLKRPAWTAMVPLASDLSSHRQQKGARLRLLVSFVRRILARCAAFSPSHEPSLAGRAI